MSQQSYDRLLPFYYPSVPRQFYRTSIRRRRLVSFRSFWACPLRNERKTPFSFLLSFFFPPLASSFPLTRARASELGVSLSLRRVASFLVHAIARARLMSITVALVDGSLLSLPYGSFFTVLAYLKMVKEWSATFDDPGPLLRGRGITFVCEIAATLLHDPSIYPVFRIVASHAWWFARRSKRCSQWLHRVACILFVTLCSHREGNRCHSKVRPCVDPLIGLSRAFRIPVKILI